MSALCQEHGLPKPFVCATSHNDGCATVLVRSSAVAEGACWSDCQAKGLLA